jgi:hypothetical protein
MSLACLYWSDVMRFDYAPGLDRRAGGLDWIDPDGCRAVLAVTDRVNVIDRIAKSEILGILVAREFLLGFDGSFPSRQVGSGVPRWLVGYCKDDQVRGQVMSVHFDCIGRGLISSSFSSSSGQRSNRRIQRQTRKRRSLSKSRRSLLLVISQGFADLRRCESRRLGIRNPAPVLSS